MGINYNNHNGRRQLGYFDVATRLLSFVIRALHQCEHASLPYEPAFSGFCSAT